MLNERAPGASGTSVETSVTTLRNIYTFLTNNLNDYGSSRSIVCFCLFEAVHSLTHILSIVFSLERADL